MALVQTPSNIVTDPRQFLHLLYGEPGVGKTSFCAQVSGHYFLSAEAGTSGVSVYGHNVANWSEFIAACKDMKTGIESGWADQRPITTIVIDSYDALWEYCADHVMATSTFITKGRAEKYQRVEDVEFGKAYKRVNQTLIAVLRQLRLLGFGVMLIAHYKERTIKWRGQEQTAIGLAMSQSVQDAIVKECDAVGWCMIDEKVEKGDGGVVVSIEQARYVYWQPTFLRLAKHRLEGFPERLPFPINKGWELYENTFWEVAQRKITSMSDLSAPAIEC